MKLAVPVTAIIVCVLVGATPATAHVTFLNFDDGKQNAPIDSVSFSANAHNAATMFHSRPARRAAASDCARSSPAASSRATTRIHATGIPLEPLTVELIAIRRPAVRPAFGEIDAYNPKTVSFATTGPGASSLDRRQ